MKQFSNEQTALEKYNNGEKFSVSTSIDEDTIIAGYGQLYFDDFEFPLPAEIIKEKYGTTSWAEWFKLKGLSKYLITTDKGESISPYWTEKELQEHKELNPNAEFKKL